LKANWIPPEREEIPLLSQVMPEADPPGRRIQPEPE